METGALMMDSREAVKSLDTYSDILVSLSVLLGAKMLEDRGDQGIRKDREGLLIELKEKQKEAMSLAIEIVKAINHPHAGSDQSGDMIGVNAAVQRYVLADSQASEAKKKEGDATAPNATAEAIRRFREKHGMLEKSAELPTTVDPMTCPPRGSSSTTSERP
jgi:hypothetical protein